MRTTLNLDEDVLRAVKELAQVRGSTAGKVLSELAREALRPKAGNLSTRNGVPVLAPTPDEGLVTAEVVDQILDAEEVQSA